MTRLATAFGLALLVHVVLLVTGRGWLTRPPEPLALRSGISVALDSRPLKPLVGQPDAPEERPVAPAPVPGSPAGQELDIDPLSPVPVASAESTLESDPERESKPKPEQVTTPRPQQLVARQRKVRLPTSSLSGPSDLSQITELPSLSLRSPSVAGPEATDASRQVTGVAQSARDTPVSQRQASPLYEENPPPPYPVKAQRRGWQGRVLVEARVTAAGLVSGVSLAHSSGYHLLDQTALAAVRAWRFVPALHDGRRIASTVTVPVLFQLQ